MVEIPHDLIITWDQTGIHYIPVESLTMEKKGAKHVDITAVDDKRQYLLAPLLATFFLNSTTRVRHLDAFQLYSSCNISMLSTVTITEQMRIQ